MAALLYVSCLPSDHVRQFECCVCTCISCKTLPQVKAKCREIVRSDSLWLAGPCAACNELYIVSQTGYTGAKASQFNIEVLRTVPFTLSLFQTCFEFTLKARLAPKWNEIDQWLVKGNDVFTSGVTQGLNIGLTKTEITLSISPVRLTMNLLKPEDLEVPTSILLKFTNESSAVIKETSISCNTCRVLPNLTPAYVYAVSHCLPPDSSFNNYDKIRLHWKKQYGYVLPASQSLFYQIFFKFNTTNFLSYPGCCVIRGHPIAVPSRDKDNILMSFINDIHSRLPKLCGTLQVSFTRKIQTSSLMTAGGHDVPVVMTTTRPSHVTLGVPNLPMCDSVLGKRSASTPTQIIKKSCDHTVPVMTDITTENDDDDIVMYGKIEKSKVMTLKSWLCGNGVSYGSKDKKEKLVQLVYNEAKLTGKVFK